MFGSRKLILVAGAQLTLLASLAKGAGGLPEASTRHLSSILGDIPQEAWEYSYKGGYLFRSQVDLIGDDRPELIFGSSLRNREYAVLDSEGKLLGEIRGDLQRMRVQRSDEGTSLVDTYQISASEKVISEYFIGPEGVENRTRQVDSGEAETEYERISRGQDAQLEVIDPDVEYVRLVDFIEAAGHEWKPFDAAEWVMMDGYFVHRDDVDAAKQIRTTANEGRIAELMGGFTAKVAREKLRPTSNQDERSKKRSLNRNESNEPEGERRVIDSSDREPKDKVAREAGRGDQGVTWPLILGSLAVLGVAVIIVRAFMRGRAS